MQSYMQKFSVCHSLSSALSTAVLIRVPRYYLVYCIVYRSIAYYTQGDRLIDGSRMPIAYVISRLDDPECFSQSITPI